MALDTEKIIADLKEASILELNDLVKAIEEEFGVSAAAPVAVAAAGGADSALPLLRFCDWLGFGSYSNRSLEYSE